MNCLKKTIKMTQHHEVDVCVQYKESKKKRNTDLKEVESYFTFSASGWYKKEDEEYGGQCLDKFIKDNEVIASDNFDIFSLIYKYWTVYHLNDLKPWTVEQVEYLKSVNFDCRAENLGKINEALEKQGLQKDYKYGHAWLLQEIPVNDIKRILVWIFWLSLSDVQNLKKCVREHFRD